MEFAFHSLEQTFDGTPRDLLGGAYEEEVAVEARGPDPQEVGEGAYEAPCSVFHLISAFAFVSNNTFEAVR